MDMGFRTLVRHRPEIDGLRAVAVLPVILFHARIESFQGGFVGVDVFFVISGFLITSIIVDALEQDRFSFLEFYSRRARRILPALVLVVLVAIPAAWMIMLPEDFKQFAESVGAVGAFASNLLFWMKSGYFAAGAENNPLLHTWSLAVEEQFYIAFPLLMLAVWRLRLVAVTLILAAIFVVSLALSEWSSHDYPDADFYLTPMRAWELMVGALATLWVHHAGLRARGFLGWLGLSMIFAAIFVYNSHTPFPSLYALLPTVGTALVLVCVDGTTTVGRVLSMRVFVAIGAISYSAYLWHQPLFAFARIASHGEPSIRLMLSLAAITLCLAYMSWRFVEQPFRAARWPARKVVFLGAAASLGLVALGSCLVVSGIQKRAFIARLPPSRAETLRRIETVSHKEFFPVDDGGCRFGVHSVPTAGDVARITSCAERFGPAVVVFGDSHADNLQRALVASGEAPQFLIKMDKGNDCDPFVRPDCLSGIMVKFLTQHANAIGVLIYEQAGFYLLRDSNGRPSRREVFIGRNSPVATSNLQAIAGVAEYLDGLQMRLGVPVVWVGPWLEPYFPVERLLAFDCEAAAKYIAVDPAIISIFTKLDAEMKASSNGHRYRYVSAMGAIDFDARYDIFDCSNIYWNDGDHFSLAGEARFGKRLFGPIMSALASQAIVQASH
jgi:peptidoglycan/LPS O-acetylase OafA/YrhL